MSISFDRVQPLVENSMVHIVSVAHKQGVGIKRELCSFDIWSFLHLNLHGLNVN